MSKINFEEDVANIDQESLESVSSLLQQQLIMENEVEIAELELKNKKDKLRKLSEEIIPARMTELGMSSTTMVDGSKVDVVENIYVAIPKDPDKSAACYQWLEDNGLGDIIKNNVFVTFGKGEDDKAKQLLDLAAANGFEPQQKSDVAWATLTALFRERIESGLDMPSDVFSTWIKDKTKISRK